MITYEDDNLIVKDSGIEGVGIFAKRLFKKGEVVLEWHPTKAVSNLADVAESEKHYVTKLADGTQVILGIPERYMNHSCEPNTSAVNNADVASRDIQAGEEITANYFEEGAPADFDCHCGSEHCISKQPSH